MQGTSDCAATDCKIQFHPKSPAGRGESAVAGVIGWARLWRNGGGAPEFAKAHAGRKTKPFQHDITRINGNHLPGLKCRGNAWSVRPIEAGLMRLMRHAEGV